MSRSRFWLTVVVALVLSAGNLHAQVQEDWWHIYPGPGDNDNEARGIGVDAGGNCYVAGGSTGAADWDFLVGKYNPGGGVAWEIPVNGPGDSSDYAMAMVADDAGNCYVSGWTTAKGVFGSGLLICKTTPSGTVEWARPHNVNQMAPREMTFDPAGNIIISALGYSSGYHSVVMKVDPQTGDSLWATFYRWTGATGGNAQSVACGSDGSVYIAGTATKSTGNLDDILVVKFSADGDTLWGRAYDGPLHRYDEGIDIAVDNAGNAYVTGKIKDSTGNSDLVILKYDPNGSLLWDWTCGVGSSSIHNTAGIALDPAGNVCVGAHSSGWATGFDFSFYKLSADGDSLWVSPSGRNGYEEAYAMALDAAGNMYITGHGAGTTDYDCLTMKFNGATGAKVWEMTRDAGGYDRATRICVEAEDHVYVAGYGNPPGEPETNLDIVIIAYEPVSAAVFEPVTNDPPRDFALHQNSPNPFNAATTIRFDLETGGDAELSIYNLLGQTVLSHRETGLAPGSYAFEWDGVDDRGGAVGSGVYLYQLRTPAGKLARKMVLMK
ncbi:MAG TPA: SBBP repeat-containing protein [bacterium]|nr:SBBP repeat-containing protein [bacterium]